MRHRELPFDPSFEIPESEFQLEPSRSGGKGGQNVNKVATRITLFWSIEGSRIFTADQKALIREKLKNRINNEGEVVLHCDTHRTQLGNKKEVIKRLQALVQEALHQEEERYETPVPKRQKEKRLEEKRRRGVRRELRKPLTFDE